MRISIIIAVYKDLGALKLIIQSLRLQDYPDLEIVIAEDGMNNNIAEYVSTLGDLDIIHTTQEDKGIRKARSLNNAITECTGEYLVFIDGDCVPYTTFINYHAKLSQKKKVLTGRRVNLGPEITRQIRMGTLDTSTLQRYYLLLYPYLAFTKATHIEQGISLNPASWIYRKFILNRKRSNITLLGCNFSCFKEDIELIDGFDEDYFETAVADDTDLQWRFKAAGIQLKSCKLAANVFHLYHPFRQGQPHEADEIKKMQIRKSTGNYLAVKGISSHNRPQPETTTQNE